MSDPRFSRRLWLQGCLLLAGLGVLGWRLVVLQVLDQSRLKERAESTTQRTITRKPTRGEIRDITGNTLATSVPVKTVCANPELILTNQLAVARVLAPILQTNESWLVERLARRVVRTNELGQPVPRLSVVLRRKVSLEDWERIQTAMKGLQFGEAENQARRDRQTYFKDLRAKGVFAEDDGRRVYPNGPLAAHVIGYTGLVESPGGTTGEGRETEVGVDGIERVFERDLRGVRGWLETGIDSREHEVAMFRKQDVDPRPGMNIVLTLDSGLQHIVETELAEGMRQHSPQSITAVVLRPATGDLLALANLPTYDPNRPGLSVDPVHPGPATPEQHRNRTIADMIEPGSTFKIVPVSAALETRLVTLEDRVDCENGRFYYFKRALHDAHRHGILTVREVIAKSSNIGAAKIGIQLGQEALHDYVRAFGFGTATGIPLPGEAGGIVHPLKRWDKFSITSVPMGHEVAVTRLQIALAMATLANGGVLMRPRLVDRVEDAEGRVVAKFPVQQARRVVSVETSRKMVEALKGAVMPGGTAPNAGLEHYVVAGKTGTAQKPSPGGGRYAEDKFVSSFIGFFPADNPQILIAITLDEPRNGHLGGAVAGPVFKAIAERAATYLNIAPDRFPTPVDPVEPAARAVSRHSPNPSRPGAPTVAVAGAVPPRF